MYKRQQRVYVELETTPWVWRVSDDFTITAQTGLQATYQACLEDEFGHVYLQTSLGLGLVHSTDVPIVARALELGVWSIGAVRQEALPASYGYVKSPTDRHAKLLLK